MPLHTGNRLTSPEIRSLLFGREISGTSFVETWGEGKIPWRQQRTADGTVKHWGYAIHPGMPRPTTGFGRIENSMLCELWPELTETFEICVVIFRLPERNARIRWGDFVMITDTGPKPFSLVE